MTLPLNEHAHFLSHAEAKGTRGLKEGYGIRFYDGDGIGTAHLAIIQKLRFNLTQLAVGGEHATIGDGAHGLIYQLPAKSLFRELRRGAGLINTYGAECDLRVRGVVIGIGRYGSVIEYAVADRIGNDQQAAECGTLRAIGRDVLHR